MDLPRRVLSDTDRIDPYPDSLSLVSTASQSSTSMTSHSFEKLVDLLGTSDSETDEEPEGITPKSRVKMSLKPARSSEEEKDLTPTPSPVRMKRVHAGASLPSPSPAPMPALSPLRLPKRSTHPPSSRRRLHPQSPITRSPAVSAYSPHLRQQATYLDFDQTFPQPSGVPLPPSPLPQRSPSDDYAGKGIGLEDGDPFAALPSPRGNAFRPRRASVGSPLRNDLGDGDRQTIVSVVEAGSILSSFPLPPSKGSLERNDEASPLAKRAGAVFGGVDVVEEEDEETEQPSQPSSWRSPLDFGSQRKTSSTLRFALGDRSSSSSSSTSSGETSASPSAQTFPLTPPSFDNVDPKLLLSMLAATTQQQIEMREGMEEMRRVADDMKACLEHQSQPIHPRDINLPDEFMESLPDVLSLVLTLDGLVHHVPLSERSCEQVFDQDNLETLKARIAGWERVVRGVTRR